MLLFRGLMPKVSTRGVYIEWLFFGSLSIRSTCCYVLKAVAETLVSVETVEFLIEEEKKYNIKLALIGSKNEMTRYVQHAKLNNSRECVSEQPIF